MRINLYLSENNEKDVIITNYLNSKYSAKDYIKEMLYEAAMGKSMIMVASKEITPNVTEDDYEEIEGLDGIEL